MNVAHTDRKIVESLFRAMQTGPGGEAEMMALFADDAVLIEPFTGRVQTHTGKEAIRSSFQEMWKNPAPEVSLNLERVDREGDHVRAEWNCTSTAFPEPMRGYDLFTLRDGKIQRLEVVVTSMPPMDS